MYDLDTTSIPSGTFTMGSVRGWRMSYLSTKSPSCDPPVMGEDREIRFGAQTRGVCETFRRLNDFLRGRA